MVEMRLLCRLRVDVAAPVVLSRGKKSQKSQTKNQCLRSCSEIRREIISTVSWLLHINLVSLCRRKMMVH